MKEKLNIVLIINTTLKKRYAKNTKDSLTSHNRAKIHELLSSVMHTDIIFGNAFIFQVRFSFFIVMYILETEILPRGSRKRLRNRPVSNATTRYIQTSHRRLRADCFESAVRETLVYFVLTRESASENRGGGPSGFGRIPTGAAGASRYFPLIWCARVDQQTSDKRCA